MVQLSMTSSTYSYELLIASRYEENAVFDANDGAQDSDGDTLGVESLATESIELLLTLMRSRLARSLHRSLTEICSVVLTYMQITQDQEGISCCSRSHGSRV